MANGIVEGYQGYLINVNLFCCALTSRSQMMPNVVRTLVTLGYCLAGPYLFLPHFDVICDLLLNRHVATLNLFVSCNTETN